MRGDRYRAGKRLWSEADDATMHRQYPDTPTSQLAARLRRTLVAVYGRAGVLGLTKSAAYLAGQDACRLRRGDQVGLRFRFPKGHVPANKGLRRPGWYAGRMRETQFQLGHRSGNQMPIGSTRLVDGYMYRKVTDVPHVPWTINWQPEHVLIWHQAGRTRPASHALVFTNGDRLDIRLENLACISRRALMARNTVHTLPKPLVAAVQMLGALTRQIRRRSHGAEQDRRLA